MLLSVKIYHYSLSLQYYNDVATVRRTNAGIGKHVIAHLKNVKSTRRFQLSQDSLNSYKCIIQTFLQARLIN